MLIGGTLGLVATYINGYLQNRVLGMVLPTLVPTYLLSARHDTVY